jgi:preprotein translocase subunit SecB
MSEQQASDQNPPQAQFALQRIFVKDVSFESPKAPEVFRGQWQPKVNLELNSSHNSMENDLYEVTLKITITARNETDEVMYLTEVQQSGIFLIKGLENAALMQTLGAFCPSVLFPYARETIDGLVIKGSFPPLMLAPVNFDAIYEQSRQKREESTH